MPQRFTIQDRQAHDRWQKEDLMLVTLPGSRENLERIHTIFAFQSNLLQNIVEFTPGNFQISVLTQPIRPSTPEALSRLPQAAACAARRRALALLHAAREWRLDFIDFSRFEVQPTGGLRFAWSLEAKPPPPPGFIDECFRGQRHEAEEPSAAPPPAVAEDFLCRREDFACHRLLARSARDLGAGANARIRINTRFSWQEAIARSNLFHDLNDAETLLLNIDLEETTLGRRLAALCAVEDAVAENPAALTREFRFFLKKSVFSQSILIVRNLARREDDRLLRFLFESEDIPGLTVFLFGDPTSCECDLEFNEDPQNLMAGLTQPQPQPARLPEPDDDEQRLLAGIAADSPAELESSLRDLARGCPGKGLSGPAAERLCRYLERETPAGQALPFAIEVLLRSNCLEQADRVLAAVSGQAPPWARLKRAHLAMRRRQYRELGKLLAGMTQPGASGRDEWLYLNFVYHEKLSREARADEYAAKIRSPYYRNLSLIQLSDRSIYRRDFASARTQLTRALDYFSAGRGAREEIAARSQMAKLLREEGDLQQAEALYKAIYVQAEVEGLLLSSAGVAVDLGNLYVEADDDFQAECWYRKASRLYGAEKNRDGQMLVSANLVNVLLAKGDWLQADRLLRDIRAWDEEKKLPDSSAIDLLNWAGLEALRHQDEKALQLVGSAEAIFRERGNRKGLGECAFLRARITGDPGGDPEADGEHWLDPDRRTVCALLRLPAPADGGAREVEMLRLLDSIASRKLRFEALRLLLKKHRRGEWLDRFMKMSRELSPREKNYFFFEYWHWFFELAGEEPPAARRGEFLAMHDFFTLNRRCLSLKLTRWRQRCEDGEKSLRLFDDARLVEQHRQWRLPADFFNSFRHELGKAIPVDWLVMDIYEKKRSLFRFASSDQFPELGDEMLRRARSSPPGRNHDRKEVQRLYSSPERIFYPFASTQLLRWPIDGDILACLAVGSRDGSLRFQDLGERCRDTFRTFAQLFRNFLQNEYRIGEKLDFIVGASQQVQTLKRLIAQVAKVDFSLLISGESGSGKELVARAVHLLGPRAGQPFISVNAAAIPDTLLEAELFGFRKGAFSGAGEPRVGLLQAADRGTLFLDEIADLPLALQAKLLRALQEKEIRRLGENRTIRIDVRLITASNRDLEELVRGKQFRADLFYRLQDLVIRIPPLRERREDIPQLIEHFLRKYGYPDQAPGKLAAIADLFRQDEFPGNVRELESRVKNLITFNPGLDLDPGPEHAPFSWRSACADFAGDLLRRTLAQQQGNRKRTAERLGISRMALFNLLKKHGISP